MSSPTTRQLAVYGVCGLTVWGVYEVVAKRHLACDLTVSAMALVLLAMQGANRQCFSLLFAIPTKGLVLYACGLCFHLTSTLWLNGYLPMDAKEGAALQASDVCLLLACALWLLNTACSESAMARKGEEAREGEALPLLTDLMCCMDLEAGAAQGENALGALDCRLDAEGYRRDESVWSRGCSAPQRAECCTPLEPDAVGIAEGSLHIPKSDLSAPPTVPTATNGRCGEATDSVALTAEETFIIFDWDDTVMPSTWVQAQGLHLDERSVPTAWQREQLAKLAALAAETLHVAGCLGTVVFVTNADEGWIEESCQKFMPTLWPSLETMRLVSARNAYETEERRSPMKWKACAFESEIERVFGAEVAACPQRRKNIMSVGDSTHEREGLLLAVAPIPNALFKSLKLVERPTIDQLCKEQTIIAEGIPRLVHVDGNLDLCIRVEQLDK